MSNLDSINPERSKPSETRDPAAPFPDVSGWTGTDWRVARIKAGGMTQEQLAEAVIQAGQELTQKQLSRFEHGQARLDAAVLRTILMVLRTRGGL